MPPTRQFSNTWTVPALCAVCLLVAVSTLHAQVNFVEIGAQRGIAPYQMAAGQGGGVAAADFDNDGDIDFFVPTADGTPHQLYRNLGNGVFQEIAAARGLALTERGRGALWFDYDGDNRLDLLVTRDCFETSCNGSMLRLYRQSPNGSFIDVTSPAGLSETGLTTIMHRGGAAAADLNGDGWLDLVTAVWQGPLRLWLNQGNGRFSDVTAASGISTGFRGHWQPVIVDLDGDGRLDIYVSVDFSQNRLWRGTGASGGVPRFTDVAASANCDNAMNDMGVALGDYDEDGDPDLYVTNIFTNLFYNILLRNDSTSGKAGFAERSMPAGVRNGGWGWGTTFFDVNNDTFLDLVETNGWEQAQWLQPPRLYVNNSQSPPKFIDFASSAGFTQDAWGSSIVAFDADRDGALDLLHTVSGGNLELFQSQLSAGTGNRHYLVIRPRQTTAPASRNARAIGARVRVEFTDQTGSRTLTRWITAGISFLGQEPAEAHFGLGGATSAIKVTVFWPNGSETAFCNVPTDDVLTLTPTSLTNPGARPVGTLCSAPPPSGRELRVPK